MYYALGRLLTLPSTFGAQRSQPRRDGTSGPTSRSGLLASGSRRCAQFRFCNSGQPFGDWLLSRVGSDWAPRSSLVKKRNLVDDIDPTESDLVKLDPAAPSAYHLPETECDTPYKSTCHL